MSPNLESRWTTWGTVSSGFREIELRGDRLESVGVLAPFLAPANHAEPALPEAHAAPPSLLESNQESSLRRRTGPRKRSQPPRPNMSSLPATASSMPVPQLIPSAPPHRWRRRFPPARSMGSQATETRALLHHGRPLGGNAVAFAVRL